MGYALPYTHIHSSVLTRQVVKLPFSRFGTISPHYLYRNSYTDELGITPPILENRNRAGGPADPLAPVISISLVTLILGQKSPVKFHCMEFHEIS